MALPTGSPRPSTSSDRGAASSRRMSATTALAKMRIESLSDQQEEELMRIKHFSKKISVKLDKEDVLEKLEKSEKAKDIGDKLKEASEMIDEVDDNAKKDFIEKLIEGEKCKENCSCIKCKDYVKRERSLSGSSSSSAGSVFLKNTPGDDDGDDDHDAEAVRIVRDEDENDEKKDEEEKIEDENYNK